MKHLTLFIIIAIVMSFNLKAETTHSYGHISYLDKEAKVLRLDGRVDKAVVNLPLVPGDKVITNKDNRCEIQFDNGTIIRLGKETTLKLTTVLANSLTTDWKITTLELLKGKAYLMTQIYQKEMIQLITPTSSIRFDSNIVAQVHIAPEKETNIKVLKGKPAVLFGESIQKFNHEKLKRNRSYRITMDHKIGEVAMKKDDFLRWNENVNSNFKALHKGKSKVPKKIMRYSKGIVKWAERWSTVYGEWVYNDLFGYVWKPYNRDFAHSKRPFFHAVFTEINDELFLVPSQPWGWAPAHLGTWVFMKNHGWTWIPGGTFSNGVYRGNYYSAQYSGNEIFGPLFDIDDTPYYFSHLNYWFGRYYGGYDLYMLYRRKGRSHWAREYYKRYRVKVSRPKTGDMPTNIRRIFKKLDSSHTKYIVRNLSSDNTTKRSTIKKLNSPSNSSRGSFINKRIKKLEPLRVSRAKLRASKPELFKVRSKKTVKSSSVKRVRVNRRVDWNPDVAWSVSKKRPIYYSSKTNAVVCPSLKLSSRTITDFQKMRLNRGSTSSNRTSIRRNYNSSSAASSGSGVRSSGSGSTGSFRKNKK